MPTSLPLLSPAPERPLRVTATDLALFIRLGQCERFLRLRLCENAGSDFMADNNVEPEHLPLLLSLSGRAFEEDIELLVAANFRSVHFARKEGQSIDRPDNNAEVLAEAKKLRRGRTVVLFQPRLQAQVGGWLLRGDADMVRLERGLDGKLSVLIADLKSTTQVKVEHRLQVAFYLVILRQLLSGFTLGDLHTAILFRPPPDPTPEELQRMPALQESAQRWFGLKSALLEVVDDPTPYLRSVADLLTNPDSRACQIATTPFENVPYALSAVCDGCEYNELCLKWSDEEKDLSLLPYLSGTQKTALHRSGITTVPQLALLKELTPEGRLRIAAGREAVVCRLAVTWPVGPVLDELIRRAKTLQPTPKEGPKVPSYIPHSRRSTLPGSTSELNPNLVFLYLEAHHDHICDRVWGLGARVVQGTYHTVVVRQTEGPPSRIEQERQLFLDWVRELVAAVRSATAAHKIPVHLVFFDRQSQGILLDGLSRHLPALLESIEQLPALMAQLPEVDAHLTTFVADEISELRNYPLTCPSLQALAALLKFDWNTPHPFRSFFRKGVFDSQGIREVDGQSRFYTRRARFRSCLPLEYAYAVWGDLPPPGKYDAFTAYRAATPELLRAFLTRRLEAIEHVAGRLPRNRQSEMPTFTLAESTTTVKATDLAAALREFVVIERHVALAAWTSIRHIPAERRVLLGESLLVRYFQADQGSDETILRLRLDLSSVDGNPSDVLALSKLRVGDFLVLCAQWSVDERQPEAERRSFQTTAQQLLYGMRFSLRSITTEASGVFVTVERGHSFGGNRMRNYVFPGIRRAFLDGAFYTLDESPDDWCGEWCGRVIEGLCQGESNRLYELLQNPDAWDRNAAGLPGQTRFLRGLKAFEQKGLFHDFEEAKQALIGGYGSASVMLVQGPPGTGKSYAAAFAIFARLAGAMAADQDCRVFAVCKTHAATDVLVTNVLAVQQKLRQLRDKSGRLFARHLDERLLDVPLFRIAGRDSLPAGVVALQKDRLKARGERKNAVMVAEPRWCVVGATPGGVYGMVKERWGTRSLFGHGFADLLVFDEASQMNQPEALLAGLALKDDGRVIVVGDHRQMPPILQHDWETGRHFRQHDAAASLFDAFHRQNPPTVRFAESFRLHAAMAEFLRQEVYCHDGIHYHSQRRDLLASRPSGDALVDAVLQPEYPLVVVVHEEAASQVRNPYEQALIEPIIRHLVEVHGLGPAEGLGVVVPHRAQRAALQQSFPQLCLMGANGEAGSAIDTVERFQGGEREVILVSATESDPAYLLANGEFLLDPRRLTVALSRAKRKLVLVASRSVFALCSTEEKVFANSQIWKNLLLRTCRTPLWEGERGGKRVQVWGGGDA